jgi:hypothetical protein
LWSPSPSTFLLFGYFLAENFQFFVLLVLKGFCTRPSFF